MKFPVDNSCTMSSSPHACKDRKRIAVKQALLALTIAGFLSGPLVEAGDNNPFDGYSAYTDFYSLEYTSGSFDGSNYSSDVQIAVTIPGTPHSNHTVNVDTGSRGFYIAGTQLGGNYSNAGYLAGLTNSYPGQIDLDSSDKVNSGYWVPMNLELHVKDKNGQPTTLISTPNILISTAIGAQSNTTAFVKVDHNATTGHRIPLVGGGNVTVTDHNGTKGVFLTHNATVNQQIAYADAVGLITPGSNFGIGFFLGNSTNTNGTGPVGNNTNQIYNPLLNLEKMKQGEIVAGYIVKTNAIQLGLTASDKNYGYTSLAPTGLTSTNSVPDWQPATGQAVFTTNGTTTISSTGSIVMDSGIPQAYLKAPGLTIDSIITDMSVFLMNSGGAVKYKIDLSDTNNPLNPSQIETGPLTDFYFNSGRNVFSAFNMLYDATNGYMGVLTNSFGAMLVEDGTIVFNPQAGGFAVPEPSTIILLLMGLPLLMPVLELIPGFKNRFKRCSK